MSGRHGGKRRAPTPAVVPPEAGENGRRRRRAKRSRTPLVALLVVVAVAGGVAAIRFADHDPQASAARVADDASPAPTAVAPTAGEPTAVASPATMPRPDKVVEELAARLPTTRGNVSIAFFDPSSGRMLAAGDDHEYVTASIVKVDILATLLLRAQDEQRPLTADEKTKASVMIRASDNTATWALWDAIDEADGLSAANTRLGLVETIATPVSWGLTRTTPADQLRLLHAVTSTKSILDAESRAYLLELMNSVRSDQAWGVSAAADAGTETPLKNGWLPRDATGLWVVNSMGRVVYEGHTLLVAVLSDDQVSMRGGITQIENAVKAAIPAAVAELD